MTGRALIVLAALALAPARARADGAAPPGSPAWAETADVTEHLGARLPRDLAFTDAQGQPIALGGLFDGVHPVVLVLAYYECPQLCSLVLDGTGAAMQMLAGQGFRVGREYRAATISFDTTERIDQAARKQASVLGKLPGASVLDWPFFVGKDASIRALTQALGFSFLRDPRTGALAHPAVVFVLTPGGTISRYLYGTEIPPRDLKLALLEASQGKTGSVGDRVLLRCFQYDPATRRYGLFIARFLQVGGGVIFAFVLAILAWFIRFERRRARVERSP
jgi:protein SCO1/2